MDVNRKPSNERWWLLTTTLISSVLPACVSCRLPNWVLASSPIIRAGCVDVVIEMAQAFVRRVWPTSTGEGGDAAQQQQQPQQQARPGQQQQQQQREALNPLADVPAAHWLGWLQASLGLFLSFADGCWTGAFNASVTLHARLHARGFLCTCCAFNHLSRPTPLN
jgi:hypothetical protein